jgi:AmmeMemoRadiSam system protein B
MPIGGAGDAPIGRIVSTMLRSSPGSEIHPMATPATHPRLRPLEISPIEHDGQTMFALRDPEGFTDTAVLPYAAALLATLMDGRQSLAQLQESYRQQSGQAVSLLDLQQLVGNLGQAMLLDDERFAAHRDTQLAAYLASPVRPAVHAGGAYAGDPEALRTQLDALFTHEAGPGAIDTSFNGDPDTSINGDPSANGDSAANGNSVPKARLRGILSPHIDLHRGGPAFAWAYRQLAEQCDADVFVVFGTAHGPMRNLFSVSRKNFDTPLGCTSTDQDYIDRLDAAWQSRQGNTLAADGSLFDDEPAHRNEHSIEFQILFLQYLFAGRRPFQVVPVLTGSFHEYVATGQQPSEHPPVAAMIDSLREVEQALADEAGKKVAYVSGGDLAHIGQRFGDPDLLDPERLESQSRNDHTLLDHACEGDAAAFFAHVAGESDGSRICGLSPTYTMMQAMGSTTGELLTYDQAVEDDGSACVSFASVAFYEK